MISMESLQKGLFLERTAFTGRTVAVLALLAVLPNLLGLVVIDTGLGFRLHAFQLLVFVAAFLFGPLGGALSGMFGSVYAAAAMHNPYILIGNFILGFFFGYFVKRGVRAIPAALGAFAIQLPWLVSTDLFLVGMPLPAVWGVVVALLAGNILWAAVAGRVWKRIGKGAGVL